MNPGEWNLDDELELWRSLCQENFYWFIRVAYGIDQWPKHRRSWFVPRVHKPLCDWYQHFALQWLSTRERMDLIVLLPRFFGKTTVITRAGQLWLHLHDIDLATYTGSETGLQAASFVESLKKIIDGQDPYAWFTTLYGNWYDFKREWRMLGTTHAARRGVGRVEFSFGVWGVEKGLTGLHPDAGFFDDPTSYEAIGNHSNWFDIVNDHVASLLPVFADNSLNVWPGTRYGDADHFGTELSKEGLKSLAGMLLPGIKQDEEDIGMTIPTGPERKWHVYFLDARNVDETPTLPERCSESFLQEFERKNNVRYWAQMRNNPTSSIFTPVTPELAQARKVKLKDVPKNMRLVLNFDCAFNSPERQARGDESVMLLHGHPRDGLGQVYYLEGYGGNQWDMKSFLDQVILLAQRLRNKGQRINQITDEREVGGHEGAWPFAIQNAFSQAGISCPELKFFSRQGKRKITRMFRAAGYWQDGLVFLVDDAPGVNRLVEQVIKLGPGMGHDDWMDAHADNFAKDIYLPAHIAHLRKTPREDAPIFAEDPILKPMHMISNDEARRLYDDYFRDAEEDETGLEAV